MRSFFALILIALHAWFVFASKQPDAVLARMEMMDRFVSEGPQFLGKKTLPALRKLGVLKHEKVERDRPTRTYLAR